MKDALKTKNTIFILVLILFSIILFLQYREIKFFEEKLKRCQDANPTYVPDDYHLDSEFKHLKDQLK